jgi:hypothetical protein
MLDTQLDTFPTISVPELREMTGGTGNGDSNGGHSFPPNDPMRFEPGAKPVGSQRPELKPGERSDYDPVIKQWVTYQSK